MSAVPAPACPRFRPDTEAGRRLAETLEFFDFVEVEVPQMLERWRDHRAASRRGEG